MNSPTEQDLLQSFQQGSNFDFDQQLLQNVKGDLKMSVTIGI